MATRERPYGSPKGTSCRLGYPSTSQWVDKVFTYRKLENAQEKFNELTKVDHSVMRDAPFYRKG